MEDFLFQEAGSALINWFAENARDLPWRRTNDPYKIWISEIILQQTRVAQGLDYYLRFLEKFPDVYALANADEQSVLKAWEGLGYYARARNLHYSAKIIVFERNGAFPANAEAWEQMKGVGPYTARAISAFAFGEKKGVLDGNVFRILSRLTNDESPIDWIQTQKKFQRLMDEWVLNFESAQFNQATMELGATICLPVQARCEKCPIAQYCLAFKHDRIAFLPQKSKKLERKTKYYQYFIVNENGKLLIGKRPAKGVWGGLYELPGMELTQEEWRKKIQSIPEPYFFKHVFTHFDLHIVVNQEPFLHLKDEFQFVDCVNLGEYPFPKAIKKVLEKFGILKNEP